MTFLRDIFGPRPRFATEQRVGSDGERYELTVLEQTRELRGREMVRGRRAGAVVAADSRNFSALAALGQTAAPAAWRKNILPNRTKRYPAAPIMLDQGRLGACVAFGFLGRHNAGPKTHRLGNDVATRLYWQGCEMEGRPGQDEGLMSVTGAKLMRRAGYATKFYDLGLRLLGDDPATALNAIIEWLRSGRGPVALATIWRRDMTYPDARGFIRFSGPLDGGHQVYLRAVEYTSARNGYFVIPNSWGAGWGIGGECRIAFDEMRRLLSWQPDIFGVDEV